MKLVSIDKTLSDLQSGKMIVLTDHSAPGTRGCFVMAATKSTADKINKMIFYGRGLISMPMTREHLHQLGLPVETSGISIDARRGISAGISPDDRNHTVQVASFADAKPGDIVTPGHIYPVEAEDGGCLVRPLFADAAKDLIRLAELGETAVICDILNEQGSFADEADLEKLAAELELNICSIHDLVEYRFVREPLVERINTVDMPTEYGNFRLHVYKARFDHSRGIDLALTFGCDTFSEDAVPLVRVHSEWSIANIVNRLSFDEGSFLNRAMKAVSESGGVGAIVFLRNTPEQHTNSLFHSEKKPTDIWLEQGRLKTLCPMGAKLSYGFGAQILRDLGVCKMNILTNKETHFAGIDKYGLEILEQIPF